MKKISIFIILILLLVSAIFLYNQFTGGGAYSGNEIVLYEFYGDGCPYCTKLNHFLDDIKSKYPGLVVKKYEVWNNGDNEKLLHNMAKAHNIEVKGVPVVFIGEKAIIGFSDSIGKSIEEEIQGCLIQNCENPADKLE
jgi:glutaredoxin